MISKEKLRAWLEAHPDRCTIKEAAEITGIPELQMREMCFRPENPFGWGYSGIGTGRRTFDVQSYRVAMYLTGARNIYEARQIIFGEGA